MSTPYGYEHRDDRGWRGVLARWWLARRVRVVSRALARRK